LLMCNLHNDFGPKENLRQIEHQPKNKNVQILQSNPFIQCKFFAGSELWCTSSSQTRPNMRKANQWVETMSLDTRIRIVLLGL